MEADRFDGIIRALFTTPSRRALNRALIGVAVSTFLAPLLRVTDATAGGGHGHHQHHSHHKRRNKRKKKQDRCPKGSQVCQNPNESEAGQLSGCCNTTPDGEGNPAEVCTDCGCCPYGSSLCCRGALDGVCCPSGSTCSISDDFKRVGCCAAGDKVCHGGCCNAEDECCTMNDGTPYCCSGKENLTCKKSGGPTCVGK